MPRAAYNRPAPLVDLRNKSATPIQRTSPMGEVGEWGEGHCTEGLGRRLLYRRPIKPKASHEGRILRRPFYFSSFG